MIEYFEYRFMVMEHEVDDLEHAGNFHYIHWMQNAAVAHSTANGWPPQKYNELGAGWLVRSHNITYLKPAFEGDSIVIRTWVANMKPVTSLRQYEVANDRGEILANAETNWAFVNYLKQKPVRIPAEVATSFVVAGYS